MSLQVYRADMFDVLDTWQEPLFDFVFADLPYGTTQNKWDTPIDLPRMWTILRRICKPNAAMCFTCQQPFTTTLVSSNMSEFRYDWVYEKTRATGHLNATRQPMKAHESVLVFYQDQSTYNPQITDDSPAYHITGGGDSTSANWRPGLTRPSAKNVTQRNPRSVQVFKSLNANRHKRYPLHPTEKPVALYEYFLRTYTNPGDLALDPTAGVLTMVMAAHNTGRSCAVVERERGYVDNGLQRLQDAGAAVDYHG
jgi:site-specific DNA-methyltransferase (adenine-specific)